jgi:hypothetical protein
MSETNLCGPLTCNRYRKPVLIESGPHVEEGHMPKRAACGRATHAEAGRMWKSDTRRTGPHVEDGHMPKRAACGKERPFRAA